MVRWCASSATPTGAGDSSPSGGRDGRVDYWRPLGDAEKPWLLRGQDHGTQVVLLGQHERHDTTQAPPSVTDARRHWITRYLDGRFLRFPVAGRGARARTPRPRRRNPAPDPRRAAPPRAPRRRGRNRGAERRDRPLVGARRRPPSPAPRGGSVGVERSRRRRVRRRALRRAGADPRRVRTPAGLRHPLRQRASGPAHRAPGRGRSRSVQHRADDAAARPRAIAVGTVGRGVRRRDAGRDPAAPGTRRRHRLRAAPRGDPQPRRRDPAAVPTQPLPPNQTAQPTARRAGHRPPGQRVHRPTRAQAFGTQHRAGRASSMRIRPARARPQPRRQPGAGGRWRRRRALDRDRRSARRRVDLSARRNPGAGRPRGPGRPLPPRPPRADDQRRLPRDHRPARPLARTLPRRSRRRRDDRGAGPGMVRADPGRGGARRPQLALERGAARRAPVAELVHRRPAPKTAAARHATETTRSEARASAERSRRIHADPSAAERLAPDHAGQEVRRSSGASQESRRHESGGPRAARDSRPSWSCGSRATPSSRHS